MTTYRYHYTRTAAWDVDDCLSRLAETGWRVHTFIRHSNSSVLDILFEREVPEP